MLFSYAYVVNGSIQLYPACKIILYISIFVVGLKCCIFILQFIVVLNIISMQCIFSVRRRKFGHSYLIGH